MLVPPAHDGQLEVVSIHRQRKIAIDHRRQRVDPFEDTAMFMTGTEPNASKHPVGFKIKHLREVRLGHDSNELGEGLRDEQAVPGDDDIPGRASRVWHSRSLGLPIHQNATANFETSSI